MAPFSSAPRLVVISDSGHARQIPIPFNGIVLGRDAQLGPPFSTDEYVSRNHVSVQPRGDGSVEVADLGSANGTYVNGARVQAQARMQDSDVLRIGQIELKLAAPAGLGDQTVTAGASAAQDVPHLTIVKPGAFGGRRFQLPGDYLVVGRDWRPTSASTIRTSARRTPRSGGAGTRCTSRTSVPPRARSSTPKR